MFRPPTDDVRIDDLRPLIPPAILMEEIHPGDEAIARIATARREISDIVHGKDDRLLVVVGPCSIHDADAALDYAKRLNAMRDEHAKDLLIIMRTYFEKPRTTVGWKGLINDPNLDGSFDINHGLRVSRGLLSALAEMGLPSGTEFLDPISPQFVADLVSWGAIGARTTESQVHRELASGLSCPVGFKNGTNSNCQIAIDAIKAAQQSHHFLSVTKSGSTAIVETTGNEACHVILRGGTDGPNYDNDSIRAIKKNLEKAGLPGYLMVDCSHANSEKDYKNQPKVCEKIAGQIGDGDTSIRALMIESHLNEGNQKGSSDLDSLDYGVSITDSCVDWDTSVKMVDGLAKAVRKRRATFIA